MDLASAVQCLLAYEASLKLAPGQKPPPPSPSLFAQLSDAVRAIDAEITVTGPKTCFSGLPPSVWSDWPLCCGVDLTPAELQASRSLPLSVLQDLGLLSLFLALHSCGEGWVDRASFLGPKVLLSLTWLRMPALFPSAHLAARVGHRLINADDTLNFRVNAYGGALPQEWDIFFGLPYITIVSAGAGTAFAKSAVPHKAAGLSLAKETAVILDTFCATQRGSEGGEDRTNGLPFWMTCQLVYRILVVLSMLTDPQLVACKFHCLVFAEAAALPTYDPVLLLHSLFRKIDSGLDSGIDRGSWSGAWSSMLERWRNIVWAPLTYSSSRRKLRPADAYTAMRLGLEDLRRPGAGGEEWTLNFVGFAVQALQSGLVRPELILRARPQLLEGLVEGVARGFIHGTEPLDNTVLLTTLLARSPAVSFHLRKFFSRSGCLQAVQEVSGPYDCRRELIRLLGPRAAQSDILGGGRTSWLGEGLQDKYVAEAVSDLCNTVVYDISPYSPAVICDYVIRDLTLDLLREPRHATLILQYLSELTEEIAAPKHPHAQYGALMVVGLGKACLAFSKIVAGALKDIREAEQRSPRAKGVRGSERGTGTNGGGLDPRDFRARLIVMRRELSLLRRRVLRELLPLAEAREAALWEGVREEEVVAAMRA